MTSKTLIPLWILSYAPPVFLLAMPYFGMPTKPGMRPTQILAGILLLVFVTLSNGYTYFRRRRFEKTIAAIRARGVYHPAFYSVEEQELRKLL
jgi:hypothetical protein